MSNEHVAEPIRSIINSFSGADYVCPQCGFYTPSLQEGYCEECRNERQRVLDEHNASWDFWQSCSDKERDFYIKNAK